MTIRGLMQRPWRGSDTEYLRSMAGRIPLSEISASLGRSNGAVKMAAKRLGLSLRCSMPRLVWCNECASWRSRVNPKTGKCRVCQMRSRLKGREDACSREYASLTVQQRYNYDKNESRRGPRASSIEPRPVKQGSCPVSRYERDKAEAEWLLAIEQWEYRKVERAYGAAKKRLSNMRKLIGNSPCRYM